MKFIKDNVFPKPSKPLENMNDKKENIPNEPLQRKGLRITDSPAVVTCWAQKSKGLLKLSTRG